MKGPVWLVLLGVASGCGPASEPPRYRALSVTGILVEQISGLPIADERVSLDNVGISHEGKTGPDGRFRVDRVEKRDYDYSASVHTLGPKYDPSGAYKLEWQPVDVLRTDYKGPHSGDFVVYDGAPPSDASGKRSVKADGPVVDLGRILHYHEKTASAAFSPVCESGAAGTVVPLAGLAVLRKETGPHPDDWPYGGWDQWRYLPYVHSELTKGWTPRFPAIVCIRARYKPNPHLRYTSGKPALDTTWQVVVIDASSGQRWTKTLIADDPAGTAYSARGHASDPGPALVAWLKQRFPAASAAGKT
jgi:hypothetical protein